MPQLDADTFTYSDGNLATVSGGKWTKLTSFADHIVTSNTLKGTAGVEYAAQITTWTGSLTDQWSQCTHNASNYGGPFIICDGVNQFYTFDARHLDSRLVLVTPGPTYTQIGTIDSTHSLANGDTVYIERQAGVIICKINGVISVTFSDSTLASGKPGLRTFDSFCRLDDWAAGDFTVPPAGVPIAWITA